MVKDRQTSHLKLCRYVILSILPSPLGCYDIKCKRIMEGEELFKCKPVLASQVTQGSLNIAKCNLLSYGA